MSSVTCCAVLCKEPNLLCLNKAKQQVEGKKNELLTPSISSWVGILGVKGLLQPPGVSGAVPGAAQGRRQLREQPRSSRITLAAFPRTTPALGLVRADLNRP